MAISHNGGDVNVDYKLMPLTAVESVTGGECFGRQYAIDHKDRWIDVNDQIFNLQTYDRGYTKVHAGGHTYQIYQDFTDSDLKVRLFIGRYTGSSIINDEDGGIRTMDATPRNLFTWSDLVKLGVVTDSASVVIKYTKLFDSEKHCPIGNTDCGGVLLVIPKTTSKGVPITSISSGDSEDDWKKADYPAKYICSVSLPKGLTTIGDGAFAMLGRNVVMLGVGATIPSTVTTIGKKAFYGAKIQTLSGSKFCEFAYDDALEIIDESAFENCTELASVHFGNNLKTVNAKAFYGCKKAQICFKNTVQAIAEDACYMVGNVDYHPRVARTEEIPKIVNDAPFQAKLWNGQRGYTPSYYTKPIVFPEPDNPTVIPPDTPGGDTPDRTPLDLSGVIKQINTINTITGKIEAPR